MAITVADISGNASPVGGGPMKMGTFAVTLDDSYPTGGWDLDLENHGFKKVYAAYFGTAVLATGGFKFDLIPGASNAAAAAKLAVHWGNADSASVLPEYTDTGDALDAAVLNVTVIGE